MSNNRHLEIWVKIVECCWIWSGAWWYLKTSEWGCGDLDQRHFKSGRVITIDICLILVVLIILAIWAVCSKVPDNLCRNPFWILCSMKPFVIKKVYIDSPRREINIFFWDTSKCNWSKVGWLSYIAFLYEIIVRFSTLGSSQARGSRHTHLGGGIESPKRFQTYSEESNSYKLQRTVWNKCDKRTKWNYIKAMLVEGFFYSSSHQIK